MALEERTCSVVAMHRDGDRNDVAHDGDTMAHSHVHDVQCVHMRVHDVHGDDCHGVARGTLGVLSKRVHGVQEPHKQPDDEQVWRRYEPNK